MKLKVTTIAKIGKGTIDLPIQFSEEVRPNLIKRAVEAIQSHNRQPYGASPDAGKRASVLISKRRRAYRGVYGHGISRIPRKVMSRSGERFNWTGAFAPGTVGGRKAHPPKSSKNLNKKINKKERRKAIRSAMAATMVKEIVEKRGHIVPQTYPFIVENKIESLDKTKAVKETLEKLEFKEELRRTEEKKIRAGKGKMRGRKYRKKRGLLIVVSKECKLMKSGKNIPGVDVVEVNRLNADLLAPGASIGRATLFTEGAVERLSKERLFL